MVRKPSSEVRNVARRQLLAWLILALRPPTRDSLERLSAVDLDALVDAAGFDPGALPEYRLLSSFSDTDLVHLQSEYVRLFVNAQTGEVAHLEASAYLAPGVPGHPESAGEYLGRLVADMAEAGLQPEENVAQPPDHLCMLLEFLYNQPAGGTIIEAGHPVVLEYLSPWLMEMIRRLVAARPAPFYDLTGCVLETFLGSES